MSEKALHLPTPDGQAFPFGFNKDCICYWKDQRGVWMLWLPKVGLGDLSNHDVTLHPEDNTISVSPSILVGEGWPPARQCHGFLEHGVWRDA